MLVDGKWSGPWHPFQKVDDAGRFLRQSAPFRDWITPDGSPGPEGQRAWPAEPGRYHLYVALICPWATRTLIARALKGLEDIVSLSITAPFLTDEGWKFGGYPGATEDHVNGVTYVHELYTMADPHFTGRATVPVLWDKKRRTIVNNESADILRIFDKGFGELATHDYDLRPADQAEEIDRIAAEMYEKLNNGVYRAGFAQGQAAYDEAYADVFAMLDKLEQRLSDGRPWLMGEKLTELDIRLFVTLIRFDPAYHGLFKCNRQRIYDFPNLRAFLERALALPEFAKATNIDHIKQGYYSIRAINPTGIVPLGPKWPRVPTDTPALR